jgi:tight adherence protein B
MSAVTVALLTFLTVAGTILAIGWVVASSAALRARLAGQGTIGPAPTLLRETTPERYPLLRRLSRRLPLAERLPRLAAQAGLPGRTGEVLAAILALALAGGTAGGARTGHLLGVLAGAALGGALPLVYLYHRRSKRLEKFSEQFPDSLDMMTRALRAGYALGGAFQVVADEMPDPVGAEFRQVFQEVSLGRPPDEALRELHRRIESEDVRFFQAAVSIQHEVGGNLAEILDNLSHVIRDRFRILSYARVLSAQHRASAYCVAASPLVIAVMFSIMSPGFFEPLLTHPTGGLLIGAALVLQVIGFIALKRIATIVV